MSEKLIAVIASVLIIATMLCGFSVKKKESLQERFTISISATNITIITDNETGVQYIAYKTPHGTGLTKLEGAEDGT